MFEREHQSSASMISCSVVGRTTRSGTWSRSPARLRTTSRNALPCVWAARSAGSSEHSDANPAGAISPEGPMPSSVMEGTGTGVRSACGSMPRTLLTSSSSSVPEMASSVSPHPHHERVLSITGSWGGHDPRPLGEAWQAKCALSCLW